MWKVYLQTARCRDHSPNTSPNAGVHWPLLAVGQLLPSAAKRSGRIPAKGLLKYGTTVLGDGFCYNLAWPAAHSPIGSQDVVHVCHVSRHSKGKCLTVHVKKAETSRSSSKMPKATSHERAGSCNCKSAAVTDNAKVSAFAMTVLGRMVSLCIA